MKTPETDRWKLALIGISLLTMIYLILEFSRDYPLESGIAKSANVTTPTSSTPSADPTSAGQFEEVVTRTLFNPERRPEISASPADPGETPITIEAPVQTGELSLSAVILTDKQQIALLQKANDAKLHRLNVGESLDGWLLESIEANQVILRRGAETKAVKIVMKKSSAVTKPAVPQRTGPIPGERLPPPARLKPPVPESGAEITPGEPPPRAPGNDINQKGNPP